MSTTPSGAATVAQLKADINAGRTGDKCEGFDPAAAPLGTDEEAAGTSIADTTARQVRAAETAAGLAHLKKSTPAAGTWVGVGAAIAVVAVGLVWALWR